MNVLQAGRDRRRPCGAWWVFGQQAEGLSAGMSCSGDAAPCGGCNVILSFIRAAGVELHAEVIFPSCRFAH